MWKADGAPDECDFGSEEEALKYMKSLQDQADKPLSRAKWSGRL
jgi:hypothetical protein